MPTLYVVGTPIGNLQDMTPRAIDTLRRVALIAAEDTRVTKKLLTVFDIDTPLTACHQHNEDTKGTYLADKMLSDNIDIALTTDAGTPCISDPGYALVKACVDRGIEVLAIPGCCASISALSVSGFDTREFAFYGFLPREKKDLREKLLQMARQVPIAAVHESPFRVVELVEVVCDTLPGCRISASCDLTKLHEKTIRGDAADVLRQLRENPKAEKGEYCLILDFHDVRLPEEKSPAADVSLEARLIDEMVRNGLTLRDAQSELVLDGEKKNAVKAAALHQAEETEPFAPAKDLLSLLTKNEQIARTTQMPICQDTGMAVVFADVGQDVHIAGDFAEAVNEGVRRGYVEGLLRKSVVGDPLRRVNTGDNTPAVLHTRLVPGDTLTLTVAPKGFGSENMSQLRMLTPASGIDGVKRFVLDTVRAAGANPCPPMVLGIGIGGDFEQVAENAKRALMLPLGTPNPDPFYAQLEEELLEAINQTGIGVQGLGGRTTCLGLHIIAAPTHIAGLPVAVNVSCHVTRHATAVL